MLQQAKTLSSPIKMLAKNNIQRNKSLTAGSSTHSSGTSTYVTAGSSNYSSRSSTNCASTSTFSGPCRPMPPPRRPMSPTGSQRPLRRPMPPSHRPRPLNHRRPMPPPHRLITPGSSTNASRSLTSALNKSSKRGDDSDDSDYEDYDDGEDLFIKSTDSHGYVKVYTDGGKRVYSCGTVLSSIGVHFGHGHPANVSRIVQNVTDNNVAEAKAVLEALDVASNHAIKKIKIYTDSQNTIDIIKSHKAKDIYQKKKTRKNFSLTKPGIKLYYMTPNTFDAIFDHIQSSFEDVQLHFVKGHSKVGFFGREGNTAADKLATEALQAAAANAGLRQ